MEVRYPPLKRGISAILARYPMKTRQMGAIPPSAIQSRKGIARYGGGISHSSAKAPTLVLPAPKLSGHYSGDQSECVSAIGAIREPLAVNGRLLLVNVRVTYDWNKASHRTTIHHPVGLVSMILRLLGVTNRHVNGAFARTICREQ